MSTLQCISRGRCRRSRLGGRLGIRTRTVRRRATTWPGVYSPWGVYDDVRLTRRLPHRREVVALVQRGESVWAALMPQRHDQRCTPAPSAPWGVEKVAEPYPLRPIRRSLSSRLGPLRHVMPLVRPRALAWLVGLGLWSAPAAIRAQPPAPTVEATAEGALLSFEPGVNGTYVAMVPDPRTVPALGDVVWIAPPGDTVALVTNNWHSIGEGSDAWYSVAHLDDDGGMGPAGPAAGRLRYVLFDDILPNDEPAMPESIPVVSLPETLYARLSGAGTITLPMGPHVRCSTHPIQAIAIEVTVDPTYVQNSSTADRVWTATPNGPGPCGDFTVTASNDTGSDWDTGVLFACTDYDVSGVAEDPVADQPLENARVFFTPNNGAPADTAYTDDNGEFTVTAAGPDGVLTLEKPGYYKLPKPMSVSGDTTYTLETIVQHSDPAEWLRIMNNMTHGTNSRAPPASTFPLYFGTEDPNQVAAVQAVVDLFNSTLEARGYPHIPIERSMTQIGTFDYGGNITWNSVNWQGSSYGEDGHVKHFSGLFATLALGTQGWMQNASHELQEIWNKDLTNASLDQGYNKFTTSIVDVTGYEWDVMEARRAFDLNTDLYILVPYNP